jgi:4-hydroxybutyrate dehydrogenase/sulfolactaldehyde 3-reductase
MIDSLGLRSPVTHATMTALDDAMKGGIADDDVGAMLKLREEAAGVKVRLA